MSHPDEKKSLALLKHYWKEIIDIPEEELEKRDFIRDESLKEKIRGILKGKTISYRYALLTQLLAKVMNPSLNALVLQKQSILPGAFDARSFCRKVIVKFESESLKNILGGSHDPYVNKPLRYSEISLEHEKHIKNVEGWKALYKLLSSVQENPSLAESMLKQALLEIRRELLRLEREKRLIESRKPHITLSQLKEILREFLSERSLGVRPQVVVYSLLQTLNAKTGYFADIFVAERQRSQINMLKGATSTNSLVIPLGAPNIALDGSGKNHHVTVHGSPSWVDGKFGKGLDFDDHQTSQYLDVPYTSLDGLSDFTIVFWAYGGEGGEYLISGSDGRNHNYMLMRGPTASGWHFYVWRRGGGYGVHAYKDLALGGFIIAQEQDRVGGGFDPVQAFSGKLDEIHIYSEALSDEEMKMLFNGIIVTKSLTLFLPLDEGSNSPFSFTSGASYPITITAYSPDGDTYTKTFPAVCS